MHFISYMNIAPKTSISHLVVTVLSESLELYDGFSFRNIEKNARTNQQDINMTII